VTAPETRENSRRLLLRVATKLMLCFAALVASWIILSPLFKPNVPVNTKAVETTIDVSGRGENTIEIIEWFDKPLIIARRSALTERGLKEIGAEALRDPQNKKSVQPANAQNAIRTAHDGWFVAIGIGTSSGCALLASAAAVGTSDVAVFTDGCDGSRYDFAGRALAGSKARKNLPVPHWQFEDNRIVVSTAPVQK